MPKLAVFVVCEKAILDKDGVASLISLFTKMIGEKISGPDTIPPDFAVPKEWCIFTAWSWQPEDEGKEYRQCFQVIRPDKSVFIENKDMPFTVRPGRRHQLTVNLNAFPIGQQGPHIVKVWVEHGGAIVVAPESIEIRVEHKDGAAKHETKTQ